MNRGVVVALLAAALFGASTPFAKHLSGAVAPVMLAALLYLGSGLGLAGWRLLRQHAPVAPIPAPEWPWLAGALLSWSERPQFGLPWGPLAIVGACACWALDNNLTRKVAHGDAVQIACIKGLVAGSVNLLIALALGYHLPSGVTIAIAATVGLFGYGISLVLFVVALRHLGTARTGAYFAAAPFAGALMSMLLFGERPGTVFWCAAMLMGLGIWLHLTETHDHLHQHEALEHEHEHHHDEHHQHEHGPEVDVTKPHTHRHVHAPLRHAHPHYPDIHHRHEH